MESFLLYVLPERFVKIRYYGMKGVKAFSIL